MPLGCELHAHKGRRHGRSGLESPLESGGRSQRLHGNTATELYWADFDDAALVGLPDLRDNPQEPMRLLVASLLPRLQGETGPGAAASFQSP